MNNIFDLEMVQQLILRRIVRLRCIEIVWDGINQDDATCKLVVETMFGENTVTLKKNDCIDLEFDFVFGEVKDIEVDESTAH